MWSRHGQPAAGGCLRGGLSRRLASLSLVLFLILSVTSGLSHAAPGPTDLVATGFGPATDGTTAVWFSQKDEPGIYAARAPEWQPFLVSRIQPGMGISKVLVAGDVVVWQQYDGVNAPDIRGKHLVTGHEFDVAVTPAYEGLDDLSGSMVLWHEWMAADGGVLKARDVATSAPPMTIRTVPAGSVIAAAAMSGDRVAWVEATQDEHYGVLKIVALGHDPVVISETTESRFRGLDLKGDLLIYYGSTGHIVVHDLASGHSRSLDAAPKGQRPTTNGRYIFWDTSTCNGWRCQIKSFAGYDLQTDSSFVVSTKGALQELVLQTRGDTVVWGQGGGVWGPDGPEPSPSYDLHVADIAEVLPTGARPDPGASSPDWFYFHESRHYLSFGFKAFWAQSGGVPVFGFPLSEEFSEPNRDLGTMLTVQYLERQRFEYHPEHRGTPYEVALGRLGAEDALRLGLAGTPAFQPVAADTSADGCQHFAETQHTVCGEFLGYWQSHGLEFDDPGISYRESLALFGYPLSESFTDADSRLTVQYFERARFEWHPANPQPYRVLLGRLGADRLAERGW